MASKKTAKSGTKLPQIARGKETVQNEESVGNWGVGFNRQEQKNKPRQRKRPHRLEPGHSELEKGKELY